YRTAAMLSREHTQLPGPVLKPSSMLVNGVLQRPATASGYLETHPKHYVTGLLDERQSMQPKLVDRPMTAGGALSVAEVAGSVVSSAEARCSARRPRSPRAEARTFRQQRRPTIDRTDNLQAIDKYFLNRVEYEKIGSILRGKVEEHIDLAKLKKVKKIFAQYSNESIDLKMFKEEMRRLLNLPTAKLNQLDALFQKIDWSSNGYISWDEFCTYMQLEFQEKESQYFKDKEIKFILPARVKTTIHRDAIVRIVGLSDGSFACASSDGLVSFWNSQLELKRKRSIITPEQTQRTKQKWITHFMIINEFTKIVVSTGDRELEFFELSNFEPYCKLTGLYSVPLNLDYTCHKKTDSNESMLFWGDENGCVNILVLHKTGESLRTWKKKPKSEGIAAVTLERALDSGGLVEYIRWKVHNDWVAQIRFDEFLRQVVSCSNDESTALVIGCSIGSTLVDHHDGSGAAARDSDAMAAAGAGAGAVQAPKAQPGSFISPIMQPRLRKATDQTVFYVHKGVRTFDISKQKNILVTGGMDRIIRIWNPYVNSKPIGTLQGHSAPIVYLTIAADENRLFSVYQDKCIEVWDILDQNRLLTIRPKGHKVRGDLQSFHYSPQSKSLMLATTDVVSILNIKVKQKVQADIPLTHKEAITCAIYNPTFKHVISASENSVVKVWEVENGKKVFEFTSHVGSATTCLCLDFTGRRLVTGSRAGSIRVWNYNNGHCLRELHLRSSDRHSRSEVTAVLYMEVSKNRFIVAVGWDRRISLFMDDCGEAVQSVQYPENYWKDDKLRGHTEDILSVASSPPNHLATSSYDGSIIVWNTVSGHVYCKIPPPPPPSDYEDECLDGDLSVTRVLFLRTRAGNREAASLLASGPRGRIHLWNIYQGGKLYSQFQNHPGHGHMVSAMSVDVNDTILVTGDRFGHVSIWSIYEYALHGPESLCPELLFRWRAHTETVSQVDVVTLMQKRVFVVTASEDFTVRIWTRRGEYVGTFGQSTEWSLYNEDSFGPLKVPIDVLVDPKSMPEPLAIKELDKEKTTLDENGASGGSVTGQPQQQQQQQPQQQQVTFLQKQQKLLDDTEISAMVREKSYVDGKGKRLRNERLTPKLVDRGGPSDFQTLRLFALTEVPKGPGEEGKKSLKKDNPYSMFEAAS
ncbi:hypothetical protein BOX15_Mlig030421g10, partial [Macrostomum lignano]